MLRNLHLIVFWFFYKLYIMTVEQTIDIPVSRRVYLDLPPELPVGRAKITIIPEAIPTSNYPPISQYLGILSPNTFGDGVVYQRKLRGEWNG